MNYTIFCFLMISQSALFCQPRLSVEYEMIFKAGDLMSNLDPRIVQYFTNNVSVYDYHFFNNRSRFVYRESRKRDESLNSGKLSLNSISFYKNFEENTVYIQLDKDKSIVSVDTIATDQTWKIEHDTTNIILGINCLKATRTYGEGEVTAWFAPDIAISDGPADFYGLPGLILQLENKAYTITVSKIENDDAAQWTIEMPEAEKYLSPEEFNKRTITKRN